MSQPDETSEGSLELTASIVTAYVSNNSVPQAELPNLIASVHKSLQSLATNAAASAESEPLVPAVQIKKSVTPDYIICLENGKRFKSLKRHLSTHYNMTPDQYRAKWGLPSDYPMVAPNYASQRSELAKATGLGRKPVEVVKKLAKAPRKRGRDKAAN